MLQNQLFYPLGRGGSLSSTVLGVIQFFSGNGNVMYCNTCGAQSLGGVVYGVEVVSSLNYSKLLGDWGTDLAVL